MLTKWIPLSRVQRDEPMQISVPIVDKEEVEGHGRVAESNKGKAELVIAEKKTPNEGEVVNRGASSVNKRISKGKEKIEIETQNIQNSYNLLEGVEEYPAVEMKVEKLGRGAQKKVCTKLFCLTIT